MGYPYEINELNEKSLKSMGCGTKKGLPVYEKRSAAGAAGTLFS
jgi:hypothetical protein